jgi:RNA polymerase sigma-70 factor (ECF subfamily)
MLFDMDNQDKLLNELYAQMIVVAYSKVRNKSDALDIVQDSWLKILQKSDTLRDPQKLMQWARAIVSNTALNVLRQKSKRQTHPIHVEDLPQQGATIETQIEERILQEAVYQSINQLDDETRTMLIRKFYYGWRNKRIAQSMGLPLGTVKARIHRAQIRLRILLDGYRGTTE